MAIDIEPLRQWIGKAETRSDVVTATPIAALAATLDRTEPWPQPGDPLPPIWHWLYFLPIYPLAASGPDGHPTRGEFLPPVPLPRRMWAGSRIEFLRTLRVGAAIERTSRIADVTAKEGRAGPLVFVRVRHEIADGQGIAIIDEHDIVYRGNPRPGEVAPPAPAAPGDHAFSREIDPDPVLLFRYSALTFNSHRIHYDRSYVTSVEGYPGLVVHGPLIATLLLDLLRRERPDTTVDRFDFRAVSPLFDGAPFVVCGKPGDDPHSIRLWAKNAQGGLAMDGTATLGVGKGHR